jgi:uncharacterized protein YegP (UPF0339 family)
MSSSFKLKRSGEQFVFSLVAANGENVLASERYTAKSGALNGIQSVKTNAPVDARFERKTSKANQPYFVLKAANHEVIGTSEMYSSEAARDDGIASVKVNAASAQLVDEAV